MKTTLILGVALIVMGAAVLGYDHYSYTTTEKVLQIGPVTATAEQTHTVALPPIIGWLPNYIVAAYLIIFGLLGLFGDIHLT